MTNDLPHTEYTKERQFTVAKTDPITSLVISAVILQEQMTVVQILGGALLLGSTFVSENQSMKFPKRLKIKSAK
ncbi:hypothetical protein D1953_15165 [Peribacillus asahii]|uniref:EamA domain-containing protein n=1 Tax=Peribacillus asahii TaxID=228899 RepID=A0A398B7F3_9BACI|nr:hypothetical protein D1953_15165 [Peribacillus asahii]